MAERSFRVWRIESFEVWGRRKQGVWGKNEEDMNEEKGVDLGF